MNGDGSDGIAAVKQHGGTVLSQDEASARDPSMPSSAIATGCVDHILPLVQLASTLDRLVTGRGEGGYAG